MLTPVTEIRPAPRFNELNYSFNGSILACSCTKETVMMAWYKNRLKIISRLIMRQYR